MGEYEEVKREIESNVASRISKYCSSDSLPDPVSTILESVYDQESLDDVDLLENVRDSWKIILENNNVISAIDEDGKKYELDEEILEE